MATAAVPAPPARQISGRDPENPFILAVLVKRTYRIEFTGRCVPSEVPLPLAEEPQEAPDNPDLLLHDTDLFPFKPATDVVLNGFAYAPSGLRKFQASLQIGASAKSLLVLGNRRGALSSTQRILISDPDPVDRVPLRYDRAYGGRDAAAEAKYGNPAALLQPYVDESVDLSRSSPYLYPRNPCGVGYLVEATPEAAARVTLPNLEDPSDPLSPDRLVVGDPARWTAMPIPQSLTWMAYGWFPRVAYFGLVPDHAEMEKAVAEVERGWAPENVMEDRPFAEKLSFRAANGASLGLQLPYLRGDEECVLTNIHPKHREFRFRLPGEAPRIWTDGRNGKLNETTPVIHTVLIEAEESRVSILWRGSAPALRPYFPKELEKMPFRVKW